MWRIGKRYRLNQDVLPSCDYNNVLIEIESDTIGRCIEAIPKTGPPFTKTWWVGHSFALSRIDMEEWIELPDKSENFVTLYDKLDGE